MIEEYLWIEAIQEELKDISKIKLSECSLLLQEFVTCCLQNESGMYFFEVDDFYDQVKSKRLTREMWSDFECDLNKYESLIFGAIDIHADFDEVDPSMDCVVTCYQSLPYYFE
ncbi:hypothetical protein [Turicibacter bilis]|uniref:Uncharacterized protein n=1 Tax=Turicibacter bilis TaxID=2735723 RepID=A0ABY5JL72_9FIRM|nr:hypothetical protein [Turicibacter bilis]MBS3201471.1 hypothetical protein [Turicibacter bilis]UUF05753.1 hypothetical protein J0J69_12055 [Turicibacter bilis]